MTQLNRRSFLKKGARGIAGAAGIILFGQTGIRALGHSRGELALVERTAFTMGSILRVTAYATSADHAHHAISKVFSEFMGIEAMMSLYIPTSDLALINNNAGKTALRVSVEVVDILERSRQFAYETNGVFDVTVNPLMQLWGFRDENGKRTVVPSDKEISAALEGVGIDAIEIDRPALAVGLKRKTSSLDLGGIGVGYAVDRGVSLLRAEGIESAFINHSGDAYAIGAPPGERGWRVSVPHPLNTREIVWSREVRDAAIATSANSERYVVLDDQKYGHLMNVRKGIPESGLLSSTVIAPTSIEADVLSTATFLSRADDRAEIMHRYSSAELLTISGNAESLQLRELRAASEE